MIQSNAYFGFVFFATTTALHIYMQLLRANSDIVHYFNTVALLSIVGAAIDVDFCIPIGTSEHN